MHLQVLSLHLAVREEESPQDTLNFSCSLANLASNSLVFSCFLVVFVSRRCHQFVMRSPTQTNVQHAVGPKCLRESEFYKSYEVSKNERVK